MPNPLPLLTGALLAACLALPAQAAWYLDNESSRLSFISTKADALSEVHRFLTLRLTGYDPERHLGGVGYLFVRGMAGRAAALDASGEPETGVFSWFPPAGLVVELSDLLADRGAR